MAYILAFNFNCFRDRDTFSNNLLQFPRSFLDPPVFFLEGLYQTKGFGEFNFPSISELPTV
jgi:hypothetical protein